MTSKSSPMSPVFHEWLDECPVRWFRSAVDKNYVTYKFEIYDPEDDMMAVEEIEAEKRHNEGLRWPR
jgi:hypothetical protein